MNKKIIAIIVSGVVLTTAGGITGSAISKKMAEKKSVPVISNVVDEEIEVDITHLQEILKPASELVSMKYCYTDVDVYEKSKKAFGIKVPFTTDKVVFTYSGTVNAGIELSEIVYAIDNENKTITVTLPEPKVISHEIDQSAFKSYDVKNSVFTNTSLEGYTELIGELKDKTVEKLAEDEEFYPSVTTNAQDVLISLFSSTELTKEYSVIFK